MRRTLIIAGLTAGLMLGGSPAWAAAPSDGCTRGYERWDVATGPYQVDNTVDEAGNDNGFVCARALGEGHSKQFGTELTIYTFIDDDFTTGAAR